MTTPTPVKDGPTHLSNTSKTNASNNTSNFPNTITSFLHANNYRLGRVIGEGSYSKVRIATRYSPSGQINYRLACKIINKSRASDDFVKKFLPREISIISKIEHPNIVQVYSMVEFDDNVYIFMDWCDHGDLLEYVKSRGFISENKARFYFRQLLSAVHYLHAQDLAHRDLKCENILMKKNTLNQDQLLISDFGFARHCCDSKGKRVLSSTYCGSAAYASPEILQGIPYNPKLYDLWSLGCILFIMLTGHMPYDESNIQKMLRTQQEGVIYYPQPADSIVTEHAKNCIRRMLEPDVTIRSNVDQACNHPWVTTSPFSSPPSPRFVKQDSEILTSEPFLDDSEILTTALLEELNFSDDNNNSAGPKEEQRPPLDFGDGNSSHKLASSPGQLQADLNSKKLKNCSTAGAKSLISGRPRQTESGRGIPPTPRPPTAALKQPQPSFKKSSPTAPKSARGPSSNSSSSQRCPTPLSSRASEPTTQVQQSNGRSRHNSYPTYFRNSNLNEIPQISTGRSSSSGTSSSVTTTYSTNPNANGISAGAGVHGQNSGAKPQFRVRRIPMRHYPGNGHG